MPKVCMAINQIDITVTRSIARNVIKDIVKKTGFPRDTEIIFDEKQGGHRPTSGFKNDCKPTLKTENRNYIFCTLTERYTEDDVSQTNHYRSHKPVFMDKELGVAVYPQYAKKELEFALRFRTRDLSTMNNYMRAIHHQDVMHKMVKKHNLQYDYEIPNDILTFILHAHMLSEKVVPRNIPLKQFLTDGFNEGLMLRGNATGKEKTPVINEIQTGIRGSLLERQPYNSVEVEDGLYEMQMSYKIDYNDISTVVLEAPVIIHNQLIDNAFVNAWFLNIDPDYVPYGYRVDGHHGLTTDHDDYFRFYRGDGGTRMLNYDDFFPSFPREGTITLFLSPIQVSSTDSTMLLNLKDIPNEKLPSSICEVLMATSDNNANFRESPISIEAYEIGSEESILGTTLSDDGVLRTEADLPLSRRVYVKVDLFKDMQALGITRLRPYLAAGEDWYKVCSLLDERLKLTDTYVKGSFHLLANGSISEQSFVEWLDELNIERKQFRKTKGDTMTIVTGDVVAKRN